MLGTLTFLLVWVQLSSGLTYCDRLFSKTKPGLPDLVINIEHMRDSFWIDEREGSKCEINEGCFINSTGTRTLLHFDTYICNNGTGDLFIGNPVFNNGSVWDYDDCHRHYHHQHFAKIVLMLDGVPVNESRKLGYNIADTHCPNGGTAKFTQNCQGISVGCCDLYAGDIDCQFIDITDHYNTPGNWTIKIELNPSLMIMEENYTNNGVPIEIPPFQSLPRSPPNGYSWWTIRKWLIPTVGGSLFAISVIFLIIFLYRERKQNTYGKLE